ncbi:ankyrin repeat domain-containing protein [Sphingobium nicotianae]|uniref:Ankyrin repeat domain-containing protein n=1 Tax=Sphingobium nicotianae TaxID=2782607 RepID=A0A9X1DAB0_9SPHN|nr:ankyrin repeat domain-containing protein [Sphingobium nicotianae]MBT2186289.1 ankyrin repeat domain-containing protein [Sphingobium nicotianae]
MRAAIAWLALVMTAFLGLLTSQPAAAQFSDSYKFLEAVRKGDNDKILKALEGAGVTPINTKDRTTGETALLIVIGKRDVIMTNYLLARGARVDLTDNLGRSPLMLAVEKRFTDGALLLLSKKANPNQTNSSGETPLIRAVQMRDLEMVRLLLGNGGDPTRRDTIAGMSAIDYAQHGSPVPGMLEALTAKQKAAPNKAVQGPTL